jgi:spermidine/putrescine transport system permease protein
MQGKNRKFKFGEQLTAKGELIRSALISGPGIGWVTVFLLVPLVFILLISFCGRGTYGEIEWQFTLENFKRFIGFGSFGFDPLYPKIILRSFLMAGGTVLFCVLAAMPLTFFIAGLPRNRKLLGLMLLLIPFWTNMLIRTYAWQVLLSSNSWFSKVAVALGFLEPGEGLYPSAFAVFLAMTANYLPFLALPLYASVEKVDWSLVDAAKDLGANGWRVFRHALLPQIKPGLSAGMLLVFIPATGEFVIPNLLGGSKTMLLGSAIGMQFGQSRDWPFGSAIACLGMLTVMIGLWVFARTAGEEGRESML